VRVDAEGIEIAIREALVKMKGEGRKGDGNNG